MSQMYPGYAGDQYAEARDLNDVGDVIQHENDVEWAQAAGTIEQAVWLKQFVKTTPGYEAHIRDKMHAELNAVGIRVYEQHLIENGLPASLRPRLPGEKGYGAMDPRSKLLLVLLGLAGAAFVVYFFASV